jgi:hypothetical protein
MSNERTKRERAQDDLIFLHALTNLPLGNAMRNIYFHTGELAFPPQSRQGANRTLQNYKTTIIKGSRSTEDKIEALLDYAPVLELFVDNFYLNKLAGQLEAYKMSRSKKNTPPRHQAGGALKYSSLYHNNIEGDEGRDDESYAEVSFYNEDGLLSPARATRASLGTRQTSAGGVALYAQQAPPQMKPSQLVESADADANVLGLIDMIGNSKCCTDNTRGFSNWAQITKQLASPSDYAKTELSLVPGYPSLLRFVWRRG